MFLQSASLNWQISRLVCGDGEVQGEEECDDGNTETESCEYDEASCTVCGSECTEVAGATAYCGDGVVNGAEACDDGDANTDACDYGETNCLVCSSDCAEVLGVAEY